MCCPSELLPSPKQLLVVLFLFVCFFACLVACLFDCGFLLVCFLRKNQDLDMFPRLA
jgi:hypothetical protein